MFLPSTLTEPLVALSKVGNAPAATPANAAGVIAAITPKATAVLNSFFMFFFLLFIMLISLLYICFKFAKNKNC